MDNYYKKLGVSSNASPQDLKKRFEKKLRGFLLFGLNNRKIKKIERLKEAFEHLIDPALRNKHDLELKLYPVNEQAPWRHFYQSYSGLDLKEDLSFSTDHLKGLVEQYEGKKVIPGIVFMLFGLFFGLIILLYALLNNNQIPSLAKPQVLVAPNKPISLVPIFNKDEQALLDSLDTIKQRELFTILRQIEEFKSASNFPQIINSCKIHLEAVSLAEELIIKYQGLLSCLQSAAKA